MCCLVVRVGIAKELSKSLEYLGHCSGLSRMSRVTVDSATVVAITHLELRTFLAMQWHYHFVGLFDRQF